MKNTTKNQMKLGNTDITVSCLGLGAMTWGDISITPRLNPTRFAYGPAEGKNELKKAVDASIENGVYFIDTAAMYGKGASEIMVGNLIHDKNVIVASKFPSSFLPKSSDFTKDLKNSLRHLKRNSIDLYQIHYPSFLFSVPKVLNHMINAYHAGKIKAIGVSNFSEKQMREAHKILAERGIPLASNQVEYSLLHRDPERNGILQACHELNVILIAYMPLRMGALTGKYTGEIKPKGLRKYISPFCKRDLAKLNEIIKILKDIGSHYSKSPAQIALRWLIQKGNVLPIPGAKNSEQAIHNAGALTFSLTENEMEVLNLASSEF